MRAPTFSAFGAILYEMLSGKRAFHGETPADTMSAILKEDPPDLDRNQSQCFAGARTDRAALPGEKSRGALSFRQRHCVRPRTSLRNFRHRHGHAGGSVPQPRRKLALVSRAGIALALGMLGLDGGWAAPGGTLRSPNTSRSRFARAPSAMPASLRMAASFTALLGGR